LPDAFDFRLVGDGSLDRHSIFIIEATPRRGYHPRSLTAKLFRSVKGRFWVDQQDHQIVKVEAEVMDTISVGLFLVRVAKGSRAVLEMTRVTDGVWLPDRLQVSASARLGLLTMLRFEQRVQYSRYSCVPASARTIDSVERRLQDKAEPARESDLPMSIARPPTMGRRDCLFEPPSGVCECARWVTGGRAAVR
jgi:hypothetical protein